MDERVMTNDELNAWRMVGADMGLEFDELGHPYKPGVPANAAILEFYRGAYDWRPLENDSDCLGLVAHYGLAVVCDAECVRVTDTKTSASSVRFWGADRLQDIRGAVFYTAALTVRLALAKLDSVNTCTLKKV